MSIQKISIEKITVRHVKAARALLGWSQGDLAKRSGVSIPTIARLEAVGDGQLGGRPDTVEKIVTVLVAAGIVFTNGLSPGVRLKAMRG